MRRTPPAFGLLLTLAMASCAKYAMFPPAVNLGDFGTIGLVTFQAENAKGELDRMATQAFLQNVTQSQRVPVVELGTLSEVLSKVGKAGLNPEAAAAVGQAYGVDAFFVGQVRVSKVKPEVDLLATLTKRLAVRAKFDMSMAVRLVAAKNGATVWTDSLDRDGTVGALGLGEDQVPVFGFQDKNDALAGLIREMTWQLTWDFRPTRRRI